MIRSRRIPLLQIGQVIIEYFLRDFRSSAVDGLNGLAVLHPSIGSIGKWQEEGKRIKGREKKRELTCDRPGKVSITPEP
jgi:hypothetical protein